MRIATWNVNSLKARLDKVTWWLERAKPDVLLMQETKLTDDDVPTDVFRNAGDELLAEARMITALCGGIRVVSVYAPNGRVVDSPFYKAKLAWFDRLARWL